ncbi:MAG: 30S ribosomal protein S13 [Candidatus Pacearchaeota archaeon]
MKQETETPQETKKQKQEQRILLVRILSTDIPGDLGVYVGLTKIKGISFSMSNAICHILKLNKDKKVQELSEQEIEKITKIFEHLPVPLFMLNRRSDLETGESMHLLTTKLDLTKEFDIKRLKKIKSYKGSRHARNLPVRGQRTKSHFRRRGRNKAVGVGKKKS